MKKNFISSKVVIRSMAFTLLLTSMTGCYKDSRLDVNEPGTGTVTIPAAVYSISGTVTDAETGAAIENAKVTPDKGTLNGSNGAYNVTLTKDQVGTGTSVLLTFEADNYITTKRSVYVNKIEDGSTIVYPISVSLKKEAEKVEYVDVVYKLDITFVNSETGEEVNGITPKVEVVEGSNGGVVDGNYKAGEYLIKTDKTENGYYASVTALSLANFQVKKGENNVTTRAIVIGLNPVTAAPAEYITILGDVRDVNNNVVEAKEIKVKGYDQAMYNASNFSFKLEKKEGVKEIVVEAKVLNEKGDGFIPSTVKYEINGEDTYYKTVKFPFAVKDGQVDTSEGSGSNGVTVIGNPETDEEGKTVATMTAELTDANTGVKTTVTINEGTKIENLDKDEQIVVSGNTTTSNTETEEPGEGGDTGETPAPEATDGSVVLKSFTGKPDGVTFDPAIEVSFEDEYEGQLGADNFILQYFDEAKQTWGEDGGSVTYKEGKYIMNVPHFSTFRASMSINPEIVSKIDSTSTPVTVSGDDYVNEDDYAKKVTLTYSGEVGSKYVDYQKLVDDVNTSFSNEKARNLVLNSIYGMNPAAKKTNFNTQNVTATTEIPAWTQLNSFNVTTKYENKTYTVTVNGKKISFVVKNVVSVKISVTDDNKTGIGHGHGHGNGNNTGGGIATPE